MSKYVITEDLEFLMKRWSMGVDFIIPEHNFFVSIQEKLLNYLGSIFCDLVLIDYYELSSHLEDMMGLNKDVLFVSIDHVYCEVDNYLEINRVADVSNLKKIGISQRPGSISLEEQFDSLPKDRPIVIIDDGCFSGDTMFQIVTMMKKRGLNVQKSIVGIMIDRFNNLIVKDQPDFIIDSVYDFINVIDWICERDFFIGVPLSGKTVGYKMGNKIIPYYPDVSLLYCRPFGNPNGSASIPIDCMVEYSKFIIGLSCELWEEIERLSGKVVTCNDVPRLPIRIERDNKRFINVLSKIRDELG